MKRILLSLIALMTGHATFLAQQAGGAHGTGGAPAFSPAELAPVMNQLSPGSGHEFLQDYDKGQGFEFGEVATPWNARGATDSDTILIDSEFNDGSPKNDIEACADIAIHEHKHWKNCQGSPTGEDPTTSDPICGGCNHVDMHMESMINYIEEACFDDQDGIDYCKLLEDNYEAALEHLEKSCKPECPSHDSTEDTFADLEEAMNRCCP
jgi:hypothetical protein